MLYFAIGYVVVGLLFLLLLRRFRLARTGTSGPGPDLRDDCATVLFWPAWVLYLVLVALGVVNQEEEL